VSDRRNIPSDHIIGIKFILVYLIYLLIYYNLLPWSNYIYDGKDFLNTVITRSEGHELSDKSVALKDELKASEATKGIPSGKNKQIEECSNISSNNTQPLLLSSSADHCSPPSFQYWDSTEAKKLFSAKDGKNDALEAIDNRLILPCSANDPPSGHVLLIEEQDDEMLEKMSEHQKWVI